MLPVARNGRRVIVSLSSVDIGLRLEVASTIIERGRLRGDEARAIRAAALWPVENPRLMVDAEKADRVLRERRLPAGQMPRVWTW